MEGWREGKREEIMNIYHFYNIEGINYFKHGQCCFVNLLKSS